ncbi:MAG TPA: DUF4082 domain-containing protein [Pirellulales bacterium]|nr:DUF4082 domain-containing protein [Pirellulales bacterium]
MLSAGPVLAAIPNQTLQAGAPLEIPINATNPSGDTLSYSVTSSNPAIIADLQTGNPILELDITHTSSGQAGDTSFSGVIEIELFPTAAPDTVQQIENLVNSGAYDGIDFYRIVPGFVAQAGLDGATPPVNADVQTLDDEYDPVLPVADPAQPLQYTSAGVVGLARTAADDSGSTEFFITTTATSSNLDYQYTVFGQVVSGMNILTDIGNVPNNVADNNLPYSPVTITEATITADNNNFALGISAPVGTTGTGSITVTANDGNGDTTSQTFQVTVEADPNDPGPILKTIAAQTTTVNTPVSFQLPAFDLEGDAVTYYDQAGLESSPFNLSPTQPIGSNLDVSIDSSTGMVTVSDSLVGVQPMFFGVASSATTGYAPNTQMVPLFVDPAAPTGITLEPSSDTGANSSDDITSLDNSSAGTELQFVVSGVTPGDEVMLFDGTQQIGEALASTTSVVVTTDGSTTLADGIDQITAEQALENQQYTVGNATGTTTLASAASTALPLTVDAAGPTFSSSPSLTATLESPYSYTAAASDSVSTGFTYAVVSGPAGFSINASSGVVSWTPTLAEVGNNPVQISVTDLAGNAVDQSFTVVASYGPLAVTSITPSDGSTSVLANSAILVQFNNPMNAASLTSATLVLQDSNGDPVATTISYDATSGIATITPNLPLANSATYTLDVVSGGDGVADSNGDTLSSDVSASFTTEAPLSVVSITPADGATGAAINSSITVQFDNAMNTATLDSTTLVLQDSEGNTIASSVSYNAATDTATITPSAALANSAAYTLTVESGVDGVADTGGDTLAGNFTASFITSAIPAVVSVVPVDNATSVAAGTAVEVTFSEAMNADTITPADLRIEDLAGNVVGATVSYDSTSDIATITPTAPLAAGSTYLIDVAGGSSGVADTSGDTMADDFASSFTVATGVAAPQPSAGQSTLWSNSTVPAYSDNPDPLSVELGVQFETSTAGYILGIRFYKGASSSGTNIGNLWSSDGTLLATATFSNETASGWEQVDFSQPVAVQANTTYIASYFAPTGNYADGLGFFASGSYTNGPLTASNSVYTYSAESAFPTTTFDNSNYYVDVVFSQMVGAVSAGPGASGIAANAPLTIQFLETMNSSTINPSTLQLEDGSGNAVAATVSFDSATDTATLTPAAALAAGAQYTVVISGGSGGVADAGGTTLSSNITWSFTTAPAAPAVLSVTPASSATGFDADGSIQIQFNEAVNAATLTGGTLLLQDSSGNDVATTISYDANTQTATLVPETALNTSATYTVVVDGGVDGVVDTNGNTMSGNFTSSFTTAPPLNAGTYTLWSGTTAPAWVDNPDPRSVELGLEFKSSSSGEITGISFYQSSGNTGSHTVNLWTSAGTLLATATSTSTTGPGWVTIDFAQPVYIQANTTYVASYFTAVGNYSDNIGFFSSGSFTNGPLTAVAGVYNYGSQSAFPTEVYNGSNYWVDVVMTVPQTTQPAATPAAIVAGPALASAATISPSPAAPEVSAPATIASSAETIAIPQPAVSISPSPTDSNANAAAETSTSQSGSETSAASANTDSTLTSVDSTQPAQTTTPGDSQMSPDQTTDADSPIVQ